MSKPKKKMQFRAMTSTGKQFVASEFFDCLIGVAETVVAAQTDIRVLERSAAYSSVTVPNMPNIMHTWYVYNGERTLLSDIEHKNRTNWVAIIYQEEV